MVLISCRDICIRYKTVNKILRHTRYGSGQKRCQICDLFLFWEGRNCPCCGYMLRTKPRNSKFKNKLRSQTDDQ